MSESEIDALLDGREYVQGEVIAVVRADLAEKAAAPGFRWPWETQATESDAAEDLLDSGEQLGTASLSAAEIGTGESLDSAAAVAASSSDLVEVATKDDDAISIIQVASSTLTTRELMVQLASCDRVVSVEPNYIASIADDEGSADGTAAASTASDTGAAANAAGNSLSAASADDETYPDLTSYQWGNSTQTVSESGALKRNNASLKDGFDLGLGADWNNPSVENAAGVVAIVDTGVDYENPDLQNVMYHLSAAENAGTNGGEFGYNAVDDNGDPKDVYGHGTHCAGIVAAEWNSYGTSGVCNGAKVIGIRVGGESGMSDANLLRGYTYLSTIMDNGVNLVATNNSWGSDFAVSSADNVLMAALGEKGAISLMSAGNSSLDNDRIARTSACMTDNPYVITVASSQQDGADSFFTSYGQYVVDVYGPGSEVMSTWPAYMGSHYVGVADASPLSQTTFSDESSLGASGKVRFQEVDETFSRSLVDWKAKLPTSEGDIKDSEKATYSSSSTFDGGTGALKLGFSETTASMVAFIPVQKSSVDSIKHLGFTSYYDSSKSSSAVRIVCVPVWQDSEGNLGTGLTSKTISKASSFSTTEWMVNSFSLEDQRPEEGSLYTIETSDPDVVYIAAFLSYYDNSMSGLSDFYLDDIALGSAGTHWTLVEGTSMATPEVAGAAAVVAKRQQDGGQQLSGAASALYRANYLRAHISPMESADGTCRQGGMVNLSVAESETTPVVNSIAQENGRKLTITGAYFGETAGSVTLGGTACTVDSWANDKVCVTVPASVGAGELTLQVKKANGKVGASKLAYEATDVTVFPQKYAGPAPSENLSYLTGTYGTSVGTTLGSLQVTDDSAYVLFVSGREGASFILYRYRFANGTYTKVAEFAEDASGVAAQMALVGTSLYVYVTETDEDGTPVSVSMYRLDTATQKLTTLDVTALNNAGCWLSAGLVNCDGTLMLVGGMNTDCEITTENNVAQLAVSANGAVTCKVVGSYNVALEEDDESYGVINPQLTVFGGKIYAAGGSSGSWESFMVPDAALTILSAGENGTWTCEDATSMLPEGLYTSYSYAQPSFGLTSTSEGVFLVGATVNDEDGVRSVNDTYVLRPGATSFTAWDKVFNLGCSIFTLAASRNNVIYALTTSKFNPSTSGIYFAASKKESGGGGGGKTVTKTQTVKVAHSLKTKSYKANKKGKLKKTWTITASRTKKIFGISGNKGKLVFSKVSVKAAKGAKMKAKKAKKYITVTSSGAIKVKKGLKKGTYTLKVKVYAKATATYKKSAAKYFTLRVKVR